MTRPLSRLCACIFALLITSSAWGQVVLSPPGLPLSGGTITPPYAGAGVLSPALCFTAPSPITAAQNCFGYGTTLNDRSQLELSTSSVNASNAFAVVQTNVNAFATETFRSKDFMALDLTEVYEHGAIGYVPAFNNSAGAFIIEDSRLPNTQGNTPPPEFDLFQTGSLDPTGGVNVVCSAAIGSPTLACAANATVNGQTIWGPNPAAGIPAETTISSGGGTTSLTMSKNATATSTNVTYNFGTYVNGQRKVIQATSLGDVFFYNFTNGTVAAIDRVNNRFCIGLNCTAPATTLEVTGATTLDSTLAALGTTTIGNAGNTTTIVGGGSITGSNSLSFTSTSHTTSVTNLNTNGQEIFRVQNTDTGTGQACYQWVTGSANANASWCLLNTSGAPIMLFNDGSAVGNIIFRATQFLWQTTGGATQVTMDMVTPQFIVAPKATFNGTLLTNAAIADTGFGYATPATGNTVTIANTVYHQIIDPAGTLATLTVNMPATPTNGQYEDVRFSQIITALTVSGNGNSIVGNPTSAAVGSQFSCFFRTTNTTWYC